MGSINIQSESPFTISYLLMIKRSIKFIVSFSLFSLIVFYFSLITLFLGIIGSSNSSSSSYFPSFTFQIFTHKNYIFLLCNGILVFLAKNSGLIRGASPDFAPHRKLQETETEVVAAAEHQQQQQQQVLGEEKGRDNRFSIAVEEDRNLIAQDSEKEQNQNRVLVVEEEEEEGTELMSTEELNKKCDEFIKKMKEGIKWESQQLVMVR